MDLARTPEEVDVGHHQWTAIYRDHSGFVYRVILGKVHHQADAEDLTAEVFCRALVPLRVSASEEEIRGYLLTTARTVLAGYWQRSASQPTTTLDDDVPHPIAAAVSVISSQRAQAILAALPERYRQVLELRFLHSLTLRETAAELGISVGNAKVLQHRALARAARVAIAC